MCRDVRVCLNSLGVVHPKEVGIENCLHDARQNRNLIKVAFGEIAIDPVRDIQRAIDAQREEIMRGDGLRLPRALQQKQLRQDCNRLEPDAECPQDFRRGVFVGEDGGEDRGAAEQVAHFEGVEVGVVGGLVVVQHQVQGVGAGGDEDDFQDGVPCRIGEGPEDICGMRPPTNNVSDRFGPHQKWQRVPKYRVT